MLGCQEVVASPVAQVMIHLPSVGTEGNRYDHLESIGVLDSITESILNAYTIKAGQRSTRDELKRLMKSSVWMTAPEAKGLGLVDRILGEETIDPAAILNCAGTTLAGMRQAMGVARTPTPEALRQEYAALVAEGKAPARGEAKAEGGPQPENDAKLRLAKARLDLERIRFGGMR